MLLYKKFYQCFAHSLNDRPQKEWQLLCDHLEQTAVMASKFAKDFKSDDWAYLAGLWHDLGKTIDDVQKRIKGETNAKAEHSIYGAKYALELLENGAGKLLAYVIAGHHAGLPNGKDNTDSCLSARLNRCLMSLPSIPPEFQKVKELESSKFPLKILKGKLGFTLSMFVRMLFSCLVDADFLDTEKFMSPDKANLRKEPIPLEKLEPILNNYLKNLRKNDTPVNIKRGEILDACLSAAQNKPGLFSLTVPTGGGKTLSSLAFALRHARLHGLKRVIYVIPYMSIIEQNASVFRKVFQSLGKDVVVEHHSNFTPENLNNKSEEIDWESPEYFRIKLASENWNASIIVTTNVQFFESLFANKPSKCRKLHNLAKSVIILDEAQMLPVKYLYPCIEAIRELAHNYGSTIVLCTATQPALSSSFFKYGIDNVCEIVNGVPDIDKVFDRVRLINAGKLSDKEIVERIAQLKQVLCIVNTRKRAAHLFDIISDLPGTYHLSARMYPAHRFRVLNQIKKALKTGEQCRVISTQLVEAGVDIDFPVVFREIAGLDSIAQAAGRCNREGRHKTGEVMVFQPETSIPKSFRKAAYAAQSTLRRFDKPFSTEAINDFFKQYYWLQKESLDKKSILDSFEEDCARGNFPFRDVAEKFRIIENDMLPVIVAIEETAQKLVEQLRWAKFPGTILRKLQQYTVQIYKHEFDKLDEQGALDKDMKDKQYAVLVRSEFYRNDIGLVIEDMEQAPEDLIF